MIFNMLQGSGGVKPSGKKTINTTSEVDVAQFATAQVNTTNFTAANIKKDVNILGVTGTYAGYTPGTLKMITTGSGYGEENKVNVVGFHYAYAYDINFASEVIALGTEMFGKTGTFPPDTTALLTTTAKTNVYDKRYAQVSEPNLTAANIKNGVTILGKTGTYVSGGTLQVTTAGEKDVENYKKINVYDADLTAENIKKDVNILGVKGSYTGYTENNDFWINKAYGPYMDEIRFNVVGYHHAFAYDANFDASHIAKGVTMFGVTGTYGGFIPSGTCSITNTSKFNVFNEEFAQVSEPNLTAANIVKGKQILGITGTYAGIIPSGILKVTTAGETDVTSYAKVNVYDANLTPENIKNGVTILGKTGTYVNGGTLYGVGVSNVRVENYTFVNNYDPNFSAENIRRGVTIFGYDGQFPNAYNSIRIRNTSDIDVTNYSTAFMIEPDLIPDNIRVGCSILGVNGILPTAPGGILTFGVAKGITDGYVRFHLGFVPKIVIVRYGKTDPFSGFTANEAFSYYINDASIDNSGRTNVSRYLNASYNTRNWANASSEFLEPSMVMAMRCTGSSTNASADVAYIAVG